jgi:hypothetical protein
LNLVAAEFSEREVASHLRLLASASSKSAFPALSGTPGAGLFSAAIITSFQQRTAEPARKERAPPPNLAQKG